MGSSTTRIAVLGSTGSIGRSTLEVIAASGGRMQAVALSAHSRLDLLAEQARAFRPKVVVASDASLSNGNAWADVPSGTKVEIGPEALVEVARRPDVDVVVAA